MKQQTKPSYAEIAASFALWGEYVDPSGQDTEDKFNAYSLENKIEWIVECFGPEQDAE